MSVNIWPSISKWVFFIAVGFILGAIYFGRDFPPSETNFQENLSISTPTNTAIATSTMVPSAPPANFQRNQPMNEPLDPTTNLLLSAIMGILGGLISTPFNALFTWMLKRDEQKYQYQLDVMLKRYELLLKHKLEIEQERRRYK